jgi:hypothetical protein
LRAILPSALDLSSQLALEALVEELQARSIGVFLVRLHPDLRVRFERSGLVDKLGVPNICLTNGIALQAAIKRNNFESASDGLADAA